MASPSHFFALPSPMNIANIKRNQTSAAVPLDKFICQAFEEDNSETINGEQREMYLSEECMDVDDSDDEEWVDRDGNAFDAFEIDEEEEED